MSLRKIAGLLAAFGLTIGLIGGGVGAVFHDQVTATENIDVGTFGCQIVSGNGTIANSPHTGSTITYDAPPITSSAAGNAPFTFTVQNVGSIAQQLTITASPVGGTLNSSKFSAMAVAPAGPLNLAGGVSQAFNTGIQWTPLDNTDLGKAGFVTWTVNCDEAANGPAFNVAYYTTSGNPSFCRSTSPQAGIPQSGGTVSQIVNGDGSVTLSISGATSYADVGFYVPLGTLGALAASGYTVSSTGTIGTNVYFDTSGDSDFFAWVSGCMTSLNGDSYAGLGAGPNITGTTPAYMLGGIGGGTTFTLTQLASGSVSGYNASTKVAVWVGVTLGDGGTASATVTAAP